VKKPFTTTAIALLSLVAVAQLLRFSFGWEVTIDGVTVPVWVSAIAFVIAGGLALMMWKETRA
jgi:hypothetical protein